MSLTITLTPTLILGVVYIVGALMTSAAFALDESSFANPSYHLAVVSGFAWPILLIQVTILARFDIYLGDAVESAKDWYTQMKCEHKNISECGNYEVNGRVGDKICHDCGKVWWEQ